jgi:hypothetical protein
VASADEGRITARVSWNGATEVARWQLLAGPNGDQLALVANAAKDGFETTITVRNTQPFIALRALDAAGNVLTTTPAIRPR